MVVLTVNSILKAELWYLIFNVIDYLDKAMQSNGMS